MPLRTIAAVVALALVGGVARAQAAPPAPASFVSLRQGGFVMSSIVLATMEQAVAAGRGSQSQAYTALGLSRWAHGLPMMFPAGSGEGETPLFTQARPAVWRDPAGFAKAAGAFGAATDQLVALAKADDTPGFKAQLARVSQACDACHAVYKDGPGGR